MSRSAWTAKDMPSLAGKTVVVTGANSGIGLEGARAFAAAGAHVVLACRSRDKTEAVIAEFRRTLPDAALEFLPLDLSDLRSIATFAERFSAAHPRLDILCNNAGVMALPERRTADGFEMQFGTNHLGHFALTGRLLGALVAGQPARVVTTTSLVARRGRIRFDDLHMQQGYRSWPAYHQSKLANELFALELHRRLQAKGFDIKSVLCHPGYTATNLQFIGPEMTGSSFNAGVMKLGNRLFGQTPPMGALPMLYAAVAPDVDGGDDVGPDGLMQMWGHPTKVRPSRQGCDEALAKRLWDVSVELTGVQYAELARVQ